MARQQFGSLVDDLRRDQMHAKDLSAVLEDIKRMFADADIPFAVVGAMASREYGYVRHTEDIDLLTTPAGLERIHSHLVGRGLVLRSPGLRKSFREPSRHVNVDVIASGEHAGSDESPLIFPDPSSAAFVDQKGYRIPTLATLVGFKIASGHWGHRLRDFGDVQELIKANGLDESFAEKLPMELRPRYLSLLSEARLERKIE